MSNQVNNMKSMKEWAEESACYVGSENARWWGKIKGNNNYALHVGGSKGGVVDFRLVVSGITINNVKEEEFKESDRYFYTPIYENPLIYRYVSTLIGGAISFKGKGRWSGNADDFGKSINEYMMEIVINNAAGYAISIKEGYQIIKNNFPGLEFKIDAIGTVIVDFY